MVHIDSWWVVTPDDEILFFKGRDGRANSPQCNENPKIANAIRDKLYPGFEVRQIAMVSYRVSPHDYC